MSLLIVLACSILIQFTSAQVLSYGPSRTNSQPNCMHSNLLNAPIANGNQIAGIPSNVANNVPVGNCANAFNLANNNNQASLANLAGMPKFATFTVGTEINPLIVATCSSGNENGVGLNLAPDGIGITGNIAVSGRIPIYGTVEVKGNIPADGMASISYGYGKSGNDVKPQSE